MKSVTIRNPRTEEILIKILHRKNGMIEVTCIAEWKDLIIDIRDDDGCKVWLDGAKEELLWNGSASKTGCH